MRFPIISSWLERRHNHAEALNVLVESSRLLHHQLDELVKLNRRRELLVVAAQALADKFDDQDLAADAANAFSVTELFPLVELLKAAGRDEAAQWWAEAHDDWADFMSDEDESEDPEQAEPSHEPAATHPAYV